MKFIATVLLSLLITTATAQVFFDKEINALLDSTLRPFYFNVASGDPHQENVIIWTKIWNEGSHPISVNWEFALDTSMQEIVASGETTTTSVSAYSVKILVSGLKPNTTYFYRFKTGSFYSPVGRTKTAPEQADDLRFAVVSCSHYEQGYFNAYRLIANRNDLNAVIHLGDYIYEYAANKNTKKPVVRQHLPEHEILTLQDYRTRYAQYRLDKDLQEAHRLHPFITEWDDHEFANNCYKDGAQNHQDGEGDWESRKVIAKKVYFEWIPITENAEGSIERKMNYGNLADVFMLDGRIEGRCKQLDSPYDTSLNSCSRTMLGKSQSDWLTSGLENSTAHWKIVSNQVLFSELDVHKLSKKYARFMDTWDGYPAERKDILDSFYLHNLKNIIIITGDIHTSFAFDLVQNPTNRSRYNLRTGKGVIGAEFVTPSITSANLDERIPRPLAKLVGTLFKNKNTNPHLHFQNLVDHGYVLLDLNNERANATWYYCKTIRERTDKFTDKDSWTSKYNDNRLVRNH